MDNKTGILNKEQTEKLWAMPLADVIYNLINQNKISQSYETGFRFETMSYQVNVNVVRKKPSTSN